MESGCGHRGCEGGGAFVGVASNPGCGSRGVCYLERLCGDCTGLAIDLQAVGWGAEAATERLAEREAKFSELDLKV